MAERRDPRAVAAAILERVERAGAWASSLLEHEEPRFADRRDRALLHELVLGVLRRRAVLDHVLQDASDRRLDRVDPPVLAALRVGAYSLLFLDRVPDHAAVSSAVASLRERRPNATGFANAVLRRVARVSPAQLPPRPREGDVDGLALWGSHPRWWVARRVGCLGWAAAVALVEANNEAATTHLRVDAQRRDPAALADELRAGGCRVLPGRYLSHALRVTRASPAPALAAGGAWVQNEASQLVTRLAAARPGMHVLDACAAPGGKALDLACTVGATGFVVAVDRHAGRLRRTAKNLACNRIGNVHLLRADMTAVPPFRVPFDRVLVDAPCSGTGTLRKHPEIRWRLDPAAIKLMAVRQRSLLDRAAGLVRDRGRLVYSVCSIEPEEGEQVIQAFLSERPEFRVLDPRADLPAAAAGFVAADRFLRTRPDRSGLDGFFACSLERRAAA